MQTAKQITIQLVNKPGRMASVLDALSKAKVNLLALAVMDSRERGRLRLVPDDAEAAEKALSAANVPFDTIDVLLVDVPHQPGAFARVCQRLAEEHLSIDYAYCSASGLKGAAKGGALAVIRVNDLAKAQRVLSAASSNGHRASRPGRRPVHAR